jgi:hypothetical protein
VPLPIDLGDELEEPVSDSGSGSDTPKRFLNKRDVIKKQKNIYDLGLMSATPGPIAPGLSWAWWLSIFALTPPAPEYLYHESAGEGITIYIYDSGLNAKHIVCRELHSIAAGLLIVAGLLGCGEIGEIN